MRYLLTLEWYCYPEGCEIGRLPNRSRNALILPVLRGTAAWLIGNTRLTFEQIADFCGLDLDMVKAIVKAIADGDDKVRSEGMDPIACGELMRDEIVRGERDASYRLKTNCIVPCGQPQDYVLESPRILGGERRYVSLELAEIDLSPAGINDFVRIWGVPRKSEIRCLNWLA
jgi:hypothetical protein